MGTKVHCESYFPAYFSMRNLNENSNSFSWPLYYGDKTFTNGHYYSGLLPSTIADVYPVNDKDALKQTMLGHEAIFKNQLYELHRLYRIQRDLMDEIKRKELHKNQMPTETSLSSSPLASQITSEEARKGNVRGFPMSGSVCARPSTSVGENMHSPLSAMKCSSAKASPLPSQNGCTSKGLKGMEMLEFRPRKVRRKMFDLQLPADEYIDTEEGGHFMEANASGISSFLSTRDHKISPESGSSLLQSNVHNNSCQGGAPRSQFCLRSATDMADLNKPVEMEETDTSEHFDAGCPSALVENRVHELAAKPNTHFLGFPKERNSLHGSKSVILDNPKLENTANEKQWFSHMLGAVHGENNMKPASQSLQPEKLPQSTQPFQVMFNKTREPHAPIVADQIKDDKLGEKTACSLDPSERNPEAAISSGIPSQYPIAPSPDVGKSLSDIVLSWNNPGGSLRMQPCMNSSAALGRSSQTSKQSLGILGEKWNCNGILASNTSFASEMPNQNGFYHGGSSSESKEQPVVSLSSVNYDYWNSGNANGVVSGCLINHTSSKYHKGSKCTDLKFSKDVNLNVELSNTKPNKVAHQKDFEVIDLERKHQDQVTSLHWLRAKPACKNEAVSGGVDLNKGEFGVLQSSLNHLSDKNETIEDPDQIVMQIRYSNSCSDVFGASKIQRSSPSSSKKILGFPIFGKPHSPKNESSSPTSRRYQLLDINLPCDMIVPDCGQQTAPELVLIEKEANKKVSDLRHQIDLNSCAAEYDACLIPHGPCSNMEAVIGIDLEAPVVPETEESCIFMDEHSHDEPLQLKHQNVERAQDELARIAVEAIIAISSFDLSSGLGNSTCSPSDISMTDPLQWFVETVFSCGVDLESQSDSVSKAKGGEDNDNSCLEEFDYFAFMTLKLTEMKEEIYMPKPLVPEDLNLEGTGSTSLLTRARKGQGRRGRQRRDFQRDILPGLTSLSRHEVTEDLQTFGELMRATGHSWHSGLTRGNSNRNRCARGRRRTQANPSPVVEAPPPCVPLVQQLNNIETGLEDRSLAGWGKTTRRPRRQRCPAGNPPSISLIQ